MLQSTVEHMENEMERLTKGVAFLQDKSTGMNSRLSEKRAKVPPPPHVFYLLKSVQPSL
jgi:hypothetical protein